MIKQISSDILPTKYHRPVSNSLRKDKLLYSPPPASSLPSPLSGDPKDLFCPDCDDRNTPIQRTSDASLWAPIALTAVAAALGITAIVLFNNPDPQIQENQSTSFHQNDPQDSKYTSPSSHNSHNHKPTPNHRSEDPLDPSNPASPLNPLNPMNPISPLNPINLFE